MFNENIVVSGKVSSANLAAYQLLIKSRLLICDLHEDQMQIASVADTNPV